jgi:hypothetical protein
MLHIAFNAAPGAGEDADGMLHILPGLFDIKDSIQQPAYDICTVFHADCIDKTGGLLKGEMTFYPN